jgi:hypothetical protein
MECLLWLGGKGLKNEVALGQAALSIETDVLDPIDSVLGSQIRELSEGGWKLIGTSISNVLSALTGLVETCDRCRPGDRAMA